MGLGKGADASDWVDLATQGVSLKGFLAQDVLYNDNIVLNSTQKQPVFGYVLTPSMEISRHTEVSDISFNAQGNIKRYDSSLWDCENYLLALNSKYKIRGSVFTLNGNYNVSCAYSQQIQETGVVVPTALATNYSVAPSWTWQWTPRSQLGVAASYINRSYSGGTSSTSSSTASAAPSAYRNYDAYTLNLDYNYAWDRRLVLNGGLYFMDYQYQGANGSTQQSVGLQLGGKYLINEFWSAELGPGLRWTDIQQTKVTVSTPNASVVNPTASAKVSYKGRLSEFSTDYSNIIMPSSIGQTLQTQSIDANFSYRLSPHLSVKINGTVLESQAIGGQATSSTAANYGRNAAFASTMLSWGFAKSWQLKLSYAYRWQKLKQSANSGESNAVMLSLDYSLGELEDVGRNTNPLTDLTNAYSDLINNSEQWF